MDFKSIMNFEISDAFRKTKFSEWLNKNFTYILAALVPALILFIANKIFAFELLGDRTVLVFDMRIQYIYFFEDLYRILHGDASLFMSWSRNLSGEMIGIFAYYLASPFNLIMLLFPENKITDAVLAIQLCKIAACGFTMNFYLRKSKKIENYSSFIFSCMYALSMYMVTNLINVMWLDGVILLPIIVYGIEKLVDEGKSLYFVIPLAILMFTNYYISYMVILFSIIYFLVYLLIIKRNGRVFSKKNMITFSKFAVGGIIAALSVAALLIPTYMSLKLGKMDFNSADFSLDLNFNIFEFFPKLLPMSYDTIFWNGKPMIYCGILSVIMLPLYFVNTEIEKKNKIAFGLLLAILFVSMYVNALDLIWHGFKSCMAILYRYSFLLTFVLIIMAAAVFKHLSGIKIKHIVITALSLTAYIVMLSYMKLENIKEDGAISFSLLFIVLLSILLCLIKNHSKTKAMPVLLSVCVCLELFGSSLHTFYQINFKHMYSGNTAFQNTIDNSKEIMRALEKMDDSKFYRIGRLDGSGYNFSMGAGYKSIDHSSSPFNSNTFNFLTDMGILGMGVTNLYSGNIVTDDILGFRYIVNNAPKDDFMGFGTQTTWDIATLSEVMPYTEKVFVRSGNKIYTGEEANNFDPESVLKDEDITNSIRFLNEQTIYKNPDALSLGFMVDKGVADFKFSSDDTLKNQNDLLNAMMNDKIEYYIPIEIIEQSETNLKKKKIEEDSMSYDIDDLEKPADITFRLNSADGNQIYSYLDFRKLHDIDKTKPYKSNIRALVNNKFIGKVTATMRNTIYIGEFEPDENIDFKMDFKNQFLYLNDAKFYSFNESEYNRAIEKLSQNQYNITTFEDTFVEGTIHADDNQVMMTSIAYEPGWTVKVDGKKVKYFAICDGLIGVPMEAGDHTVTFSFFPHGMKIGIALSIIGILSIVLIGIYERKKHVSESKK